METVIVAHTLHGSFYYLEVTTSGQMGQAENFNAQFLTGRGCLGGNGEDTTPTSGPAMDARSPWTISHPSDLPRSTGSGEVADTQEKQNFILFSPETIKVEPQSPVLIQFPDYQNVVSGNVLEEPAFNLFRQGLIAASFLGTFRKHWVHGLLRSTRTKAQNLPASVCLLHCAILCDQPGLSAYSVSQSQLSPTRLVQERLLEEHLQAVIASLGIGDLTCHSWRWTRL